MRAVRSEKEEELTFFDGGKLRCQGKRFVLTRQTIFFGFFFFPSLSLSFFFFDLMERKGK